MIDRGSVRALVTIRKAEEGEAKLQFAEARHRMERAVETMGRTRQAARQAETRATEAELAARRLVERGARAGDIGRAVAFAQAKRDQAHAARERQQAAAALLDEAKRRMEEARARLASALRRREGAEAEGARARRATESRRTRREEP